MNRFTRTMLFAVGAAVAVAMAAAGSHAQDPQEPSEETVRERFEAAKAGCEASFAVLDEAMREADDVWARLGRARLELAVATASTDDSTLWDASIGVVAKVDQSAHAACWLRRALELEQAGDAPEGDLDLPYYERDAYSSLMFSFNQARYGSDTKLTTITEALAGRSALVTGHATDTRVLVSPGSIAVYRDDLEGARDDLAQYQEGLDAWFVLALNCRESAAAKRAEAADLQPAIDGLRAEYQTANAAWEKADAVLEPYHNASTSAHQRYDAAAAAIATSETELDRLDNEIDALESRIVGYERDVDADPQFYWSHQSECDVINRGTNADGTEWVEFRYRPLSRAIASRNTLIDEYNALLDRRDEQYRIRDEEHAAWQVAYDAAKGFYDAEEAAWAARESALNALDAKRSEQGGIEEYAYALDDEAARATLGAAEVVEWAELLADDASAAKAVWLETRLPYMQEWADWLEALLAE